MNKQNKNFQIRNSTADFLIFTRQNGEDGIAVRVEDKNVWLRSEAIAELFQKSRPTIVEHLRNIFASGELNKNSVCRNFRQTADDGKSYQVKFYNPPNGWSSFEGFVSCCKSVLRKYHEYPDAVIETAG